MNMKKWMTRTTYVGLFATVTIVGTQFFSTLSAVGQARESAVLAWAESHPDETEVLQRYRRECVAPPANTSLDKIPLPPMTIAECAGKVGGESLASAIDEASQSVEVPAPLRWL